MYFFSCTSFQEDLQDFLLMKEGLFFQWMINGEVCVGLFAMHDIKKVLFAYAPVFPFLEKDLSVL